MNKNDSLEGQVPNLAFLEEMYLQSQSGKGDPSWGEFFKHFDDQSVQSSNGVFSSQIKGDNERIHHLINAYRRHGHLIANVNPIALEKRALPKQLKLENLGFSESEMEIIFPSFGLLSEEKASLKAIITVLNQHYCQHVGYEFKEFTDPLIESWIQGEIESGRFDQPLNLEDKLAVLDLLTRAEVLENFLQIKHVGKKRFSLEGSESLIPMLSLLVSKAAEDGVEEFCIGMSHRGRLNVLANILNKSIASILKDFDEEYEPALTEGMGDIRYHKGHANESVNTYRGNVIKLTVAPNPSHLESVNPVVQGQAHARQFQLADEEERRHVIPLLMHGDAALSGQGVVYETLQMIKLPGFETGGTLHIVINNQIGFTTSPEQGRSTLYCTDIAKTFQAPVFHVNAEDPEMCVKIALFALEIRQRFHCEVFIDLNCYRKYGHNEGDEPAFTQPLEYQKIHQKPSIRTLYLEKLILENQIDEKVAAQRLEMLKKHLQEACSEILLTKEISLGNAVSSEYSHSSSLRAFNSSLNSVETRVDLSLLEKVAHSFIQIPAGFHIHSKVKSLFQDRYQSVAEDKPIDWGTAELLAYGTLVCQGRSVRLAGQDSGRGTFSHRHALWVDQLSNQSYFPLAHIQTDQARFEVLNTCLSEVAALGFEYGYSTIYKEGLNIWEAQFGDFVNSAQVIIDQYIASGEQKWGQTSNLVLLLPHGFEGQGPEHSSARFERFLSLAGHHNMQIVNPTTPAQLFHLLRRQVMQPFQKPLIILTPKGLLRHPSCISHVKDLTGGHFFSVIDDPKKPVNVKKIVLCTGRIYYDLEAYREKEKRTDIALIRIEQLYPLNLDELKAVISRYGSFEACLWVQDEPENMGAWSYMSRYLAEILPSNLSYSYVGREQSASPATGFYARHKQEQANILHQVFKI